MIKFILNFIDGKIKVIFLFTMVSLFGTATSISLPYFNGKFIDLITTSISGKIVVSFAAFIGIISVLSIFIMYIYGMVEAKIKLKISYNIYQHIIGHFQKLSLNTQKKFNASYLNQRINTDISILTDFFLKYYINIFIQIISLMFILILILNLNHKIGLITILMVPIYILVYMKFKEPLYKQGTNIKDSGARYFKIGSEQIDATTEIIANSLYESSKNRIFKEFKNFYNATMKYTKVLYIFKCFDEGLTSLFQIAILLFGGFEVIKGKLSLGEFVIANSYYKMVFNEIKFFLNVGKQYQDTKNSYDRIIEILSIEKDTNGHKVVEKIDNIKINNISHVYSQATTTNPITIQLKRGKPHIIKGGNGRGKSTLLRLLNNMLKRTDGEIYYNDINIDDIDMINLRKNNISMYVQNSKLFDDTVIENIKYYCNMDKNEIIDSIREKNLSEMFLNENFNINNYFDKEVHELSGGENQKVNLLCVLLKHSELLILDEPTSNMDEFSSIALSKYINNISSECIVVVVTHDEKFTNKFGDYIEVAI